MRGEVINHPGSAADVLAHLAPGGAGVAPVVGYDVGADVPQAPAQGAGTQNVTGGVPGGSANVAELHHRDPRDPNGARGGESPVEPDGRAGRLDFYADEATPFLTAGVYGAERPRPTLWGRLATMPHTFTLRPFGKAYGADGQVNGSHGVIAAGARFPVQAQQPQGGALPQTYRPTPAPWAADAVVR